MMVAWLLFEQIGAFGYIYYSSSDIVSGKGVSFYSHTSIDFSSDTI
jgi:hypothetical protein